MSTSLWMEILKEITVCQRKYWEGFLKFQTEPIDTVNPSWSGLSFLICCHRFCNITKLVATSWGRWNSIITCYRCPSIRTNIFHILRPVSSIVGASGKRKCTPQRIWFIWTHPYFNTLSKGQACQLMVVFMRQGHLASSIPLVGYSLRHKLRGCLWCPTSSVHFLHPASL